MSFKVALPRRIVEKDPNSISFRLLRVMATLTRRLSSKSLPTLPLLLLRTNDTIVTNLSRPWNLSIVLISRPSDLNCFISGNVSIKRI